MLQGSELSEHEESGGPKVPLSVPQTCQWSHHKLVCAKQWLPLSSVVNWETSTAPSSRQLDQRSAVSSLHGASYSASQVMSRMYTPSAGTAAGRCEACNKLCMV